MVDYLILKEFLFSLAIGALIGLEREYAAYKKNSSDFAGIRTFPLIALLGTLSAYLANIATPWLIIISATLIGVLIISAYQKNSKLKQLGTTSEVAALITFFLGVLIHYNEISLALSIAVIVTIILYAKHFLHNFAKKLKPEEMADTLKFAVVAFVILPFLPNKGYGPLELFNPYVVWLMVVFISGIGFFGYIMMKWFGERGVALAGILGGLVSSTAVTTSFAQRSVREKKIYLALVLGVTLANTLMFVRVLIEVFVINTALFWEVLTPFIILTVSCFAFSYFLWEKAKKVKGKVQLDSPFTIGPALKFGVIFAMVLALVKIADVYLSTKGVYIVSLISGIADVDAITVSLSQLAKSTLDLNTARNGILIAALTNVFVKGSIAYGFGSKKFGRTIAIVFTVLLIIGLLFLFL